MPLVVEHGGMNRRRLIAAVGAGSASFLGGCLSEAGDEDGDPIPLDGEWVLRGRVVNRDDRPRSWRIESRSLDRRSVGAAYATVPAGASWDVELRGRLFDEEREVYAESDGGTASEPWRPTECDRLLATLTITDGNPALETECQAE